MLCFKPYVLPSFDTVLAPFDAVVVVAKHLPRILFL